MAWLALRAEVFDEFESHTHVDDDFLEGLRARRLEKVRERDRVYRKRYYDRLKSTPEGRERLRQKAARDLARRHADPGSMERQRELARRRNQRNAPPRLRRCRCRKMFLRESTQKYCSLRCVMDAKAEHVRQCRARQRGQGRATYEERQKAVLPTGRKRGGPKGGAILDLGRARQMRASGMSYQAIGLHFGVTRQAVHHALTREKTREAA